MSSTTSDSSTYIELLGTRRSIARVAHYCYVCCDDILPGQRYIRETWVWKGLRMLDNPIVVRKHHEKCQYGLDEYGE